MVRESLPSNWPRDVPLSAVPELIEKTGWALVWVPGQEVIDALLRADDDDLADVLLANAPAVIQAVHACLDEVEHTELSYLAACTHEAADCYADGRVRASQALSASILTGFIQSTLGFDRLADARDKLKKYRWEESTLTYFRYALILSTIPQSLERFYQGDPIPAAFNRHATVHQPSPEQFTPLNALVGLLLVTALVREFQELEGSSH